MTRALPTAAWTLRVPIKLATVRFVPALAIFYSVFAAPAVAQNNCGPYAAMVGSLTGARYGEVPVARGLVGDQQGNILAVMETYTNPDTGTFTVLLVSPDGQACMVTSGGSYEAIALPLPGDPA